MITFEITDKVYPIGTDFSEPVEIGQFTLDMYQRIVSGMIGQEYTVSEEGGSIGLFVSPVGRKTPALSAYLTNFQSGGYPPQSSPAMNQFGAWHMWDTAVSGSTHYGLFDSVDEQNTLTGNLNSSDPVEFGVYITPGPDVDENGLTYGTITLVKARLAMLIN